MSRSLIAVALAATLVGGALGCGGSTKNQAPSQSDAKLRQRLARAVGGDYGAASDRDARQASAASVDMGLGGQDPGYTTVDNAACDRIPSSLRRSLYHDAPIECSIDASGHDESGASVSSSENYEVELHGSCFTAVAETPDGDATDRLKGCF